MIELYARLKGELVEKRQEVAPVDEHAPFTSEQLREIIANDN